MKEKLDQLYERAKELACLYRIEELLSRDNLSEERIFYNLLTIIPEGWQYPGICHVKIIVDNRSFTLSDFVYSKWFQVSKIKVEGEIIGSVQVFYSTNFNKVNPFQQEEQRLLNSIADKISTFLLHRNMKEQLHAKHIQKQKHSDSDLTHWEWRIGVTQSIVNSLDYTRFGVKDIYLIGSVKEGVCGPKSDIDIIVHFIGNEKQQCELKAYFLGWGDSLAHQNLKRTGYKTDGLIDLHIITDEDLINKTSFAVMINHPDNLAKLLKKR